jgi:hypothetical protein
VNLVFVTDCVGIQLKTEKIIIMSDDFWDRLTSKGGIDSVRTQEMVERFLHAQYFLIVFLVH